MTPSDRELRTFAGLRRIIATLRGPNGCPWDHVQTHESLRPFLLEEASEALAALDEGDPAHLCEELGDVLGHVLFQTQIAEELGEFTLEDVVSGIADKLVRRHPHVFGEAVAAVAEVAETPEAVVEQWEELKRDERGGASALSGVPNTLPALVYAQALQRRAARAGFTWETVDQAWEALQEELDELRRAETREERREEAGDALFALANLARMLDADAEESLRSTCRRFRRLFQRSETLAAERGRDYRDLSLDEKLTLWQEAKGTG